LAQHDAEVCRCGWHPILADDKSNSFTPEVRVCPVCAGRAGWDRVLDEQDKVPHDAPAKTARPSDGRHSYMRMLTPEQAAAVREG
jgi:hypothetical protein